MFQFPAISKKAVRIFRNHYQCDACPHEFSDEMLCIASSFCPCCDAECQPYSSEQFTVDLPEFDLGDADGG